MKLVSNLLSGFLCCVAVVVSAQAASLADAAEEKKWAEVRVNASRRDAVNEAQADGSTALLWAAHHDDEPMVSFLLEKGAKPDLANRYGLTPLSEAALNGNAAVVARLLAAGASPDLPAEGGDTPLMIAARSGSNEAVRMLIAKGANVNHRESWHQETALMWAAAENHADVVRTLVAAGAEVNAVSEAFDWKDIKHGSAITSVLPFGGLTALMHAARENSVEAVQALLEHGADPNRKDPKGFSTLRIAAVNANLDVAQLLVSHGANPGEGALPDLVRMASPGAIPLVSRPWAIPARNRPNKTDFYDLVQSMLDHGAGVDSLPDVSIPKNNPVSVNVTPTLTSETALFLAAHGGDLKLMRLLLDHGADPNRATKAGITPVMAALEYYERKSTAFPQLPLPSRALENRKSAVELLLERGARIDAQDNGGRTALHWMADLGANELIEFLAAKGARLDLRDSSNRTPLDVANGAHFLLPPSLAGFIDPGPVTHEQTVAVLRKLMADAGVPVRPYKAPSPLLAPPASPGRDSGAPPGSPPVAVNKSPEGAASSIARSRQ
jgi:uncharacterized protein